MLALPPFFLVLDMCESAPGPLYLTRFAQAVKRVQERTERRLASIDQELKSLRLHLNVCEQVPFADRRVAVCMSQHPRVGGAPPCHLASLPDDILQSVVAMTM